MELKDILTIERKEHNLTQQELANILCITRAAYAKYETGQNIPPIPVLSQLADLYKCSVDYLIGRYGSK